MGSLSGLELAYHKIYNCTQNALNQPQRWCGLTVQHCYGFFTVNYSAHSIVKTKIKSPPGYFLKIAFIKVISYKSYRQWNAHILSVRVRRFGQICTPVQPPDTEHSTTPQSFLVPSRSHTLSPHRSKHSCGYFVHPQMSFSCSENFSEMESYSNGTSWVFVSPAKSICWNPNP